MSLKVKISLRIAEDNWSKKNNTLKQQQQQKSSKQKQKVLKKLNSKELIPKK